MEFWGPGQQRPAAHNYAGTARHHSNTPTYLLDDRVLNTNNLLSALKPTRLVEQNFEI